MWDIHSCNAMYKRKLVSVTWVVDLDEGAQAGAVELTTL